MTILQSFPVSVQPPLSHRQAVLRMPRLDRGVSLGINEQATGRSRRLTMELDPPIHWFRMGKSRNYGPDALGMKDVPR